MHRSAFITPTTTRQVLKEPFINYVRGIDFELFTLFLHNFLHAKKSLLDAQVFKKYQDLATHHNIYMYGITNYKYKAQRSF